MHEDTIERTAIATAPEGRGYWGRAVQDLSDIGRVCRAFNKWIWIQAAHLHTISDFFDDDSALQSIWINLLYFSSYTS